MEGFNLSPLFGLITRWNYYYASQWTVKLKTIKEYRLRILPQQICRYCVIFLPAVFLWKHGCHRVSLTSLKTSLQPNCPQNSKDSGINIVSSLAITSLPAHTTAAGRQTPVSHRTSHASHYLCRRYLLQTDHFDLLEQ